MRPPALLLAGVLALAGMAGVATAQGVDPTPPDEIEVGPADTDAALRAGFMLIDWTKLPAIKPTICRELDAALLAPLFRSKGVQADYDLDCASATVTGPVADVLLLVRGDHPLLNANDMEGHRLFVFTREGEGWRMVLTTQAMAVGVKGGEIASVQPEGIVRYRWNGRTFAEVR